MHILLYFFLPFRFFWELPQNLIGIVVFGIMKRRNLVQSIQHEQYRIFIQTPHTGVSLGWLVFWTPAGNRFSHLVNDCRMHEFGHAKQSSMLGPLYLLIVGIPSLGRVLYSRWHKKKYGKPWENYFDSFPENWADKLGGITKANK
jgi:hypothetical protein